jgi:hypothetical protein
MRPILLAAILALLSACGPQEEPAPPPPNPIEERMAPAREGAKEAERAMQESADRMNAAADSAR